jgi:tetratricopeptide (TPR) repeat protein
MPEKLPRDGSGGGARATLVGVSPRTRVRALVGVAALAAAGIAVGATLIGGSEDAGPGAPAAKRGAPGLELSVVVRNDSEAKTLRAAERSYDRGNRAAARRQFEALLSADPGSLEAAVGAAVVSWPDGTLAKLRALANQHPDSALVRLHLGLALYANGDDRAAVAQWREAKRADPDTPSALRAEDLLHPDMAPGRPFFFASFGVGPSLQGDSAAEQLDQLRARAETGGVKANLLYGVALQRVGRMVSAGAAFERARALDTKSLEAQVAEAVGRFDKDAPAAAFSRLGPLARDHPRSALVRFHLGLLLLWIRDVDDAREQLQRASAAERHGFYGREARALLSRLEAIRT